MAPAEAVLKLSELIGTRVETESGQQLGRVFDVQVEQREERLCAISFLLGRAGFAERLGFEVPTSRASRVRWEDVVSVGRDRVIVRTRSESRDVQ